MAITAQPDGEQVGSPDESLVPARGVPLLADSHASGLDEGDVSGGAAHVRTQRVV